MRKLPLQLWVLIFLAYFISPKGWPMDPKPAGPSLLPMPVKMDWRGEQNTLDASFRLALTGAKDDRLDRALGRFLKRLEKRTGLHFVSPLSSDPSQASLVIHCQAKGLPVQKVGEDESYSLTFTAGTAKLSAKDPLGVLRGLETFLQLVQPLGTGAWIYGANIQDQPRFPWRGLMIDACRHWMPLEVIERNLDGMAEAKLNVFHWHLSENQGFRVESKVFPKLHQLGSDGNYYSQEQIQEIVAYARERGIRVVPEFDMPGHSTAWLAGYPELAAAPGPYSVEKKFGVFDPCFDPSKEETYRFLDAFIGEMAALFPDEYFHIGGDEVNGKHWNENTGIQRFMNDHGLKTNEDLQAY